MTELKTQENDGNVLDFINGVEGEIKRSDSLELFRIMQKITGVEARMWGTSIVGFGRFQYKYASGKKGEWFLTGFSPRKQSLTLYIMDGFARYDELLGKLGKHGTGKSCLYIKRLSDVNPEVLQELILESVKHLDKP